MSVHCDKCGYQNDLQHSFCGMCGAKLPVVPAPVAVAATEPSHPGTAPKAAGSSILGLADEPTEKGGVSYLLEEVEAPTTHWGRYVLLAVLVVGVGLVGWYWRENVRGWIAGRSGNSSAGQAAEAGTAAAAAPGETTPSAPAEVPATASSTPPPPAEQPKTGSDSQAQGTSPAAAQPASAQSQPAAPPEQTGQTDTQTPAVSGAAAPSPAPATEPAPAETSGPAQPSPGTEAPAPKPSSPQPKPTNPSGAEALEAQGERYLYGNGVPANCGLARRNLLAAANRSNGKAQSVLGTMYATGHCVTRDLPVAYGWFAKALHQDQGNTRYEQDLKVLWRQMTEAERKVALQGQ